MRAPWYHQGLRGPATTGGAARHLAAPVPNGADRPFPAMGKIAAGRSELPPREREHVAHAARDVPWVISLLVLGLLASASDVLLDVTDLRSNRALGSFDRALELRPAVAGGGTHGLLRSPLEILRISLDLIFVHWPSPRRIETQGSGHARAGAPA